MHRRADHAPYAGVLVTVVARDYIAVHGASVVTARRARSSREAATLCWLTLAAASVFATAGREAITADRG